MRILDLVLESQDPERAAAFYTGTFGRDWISFVEGAPPAPYHVALAAPAGSITNAFEWAHDRLDLIGDGIYDFASWNADAFYFTDDDGNILELIARRGSAAPFDPQAVLGICELGIPSPDAPADVDRIEETFGLEVFDGDRETFTAMGDAEGLLIVVAEGRAWMPTDVPAAAGRAEVTIDAPRAGELQAGATMIRSRG